MTWIQTASGKVVDLINPDPRTVDPRDIAHHLALINRFNGATHTPYSVAQHSLLVADIVTARTAEFRCDEDRRKLVLAALLHDAHEAFIGDLSRPMKEAMQRVCKNQNPLEVLQTAADVAVFCRFGLSWPLKLHHAELIHEADMIALATEARDLMADPPTPWPKMPDPLNFVIKPLPWAKAEDDFLKRLSSLMDSSHEARFVFNAITNPAA
ncbi:MAG: phosphohydrolase [Alphaproteobacteria bacterium]|nr:phosphohydrolase [Alphaproteobacteria bacterium]